MFPVLLVTFVAVVATLGVPACASAQDITAALDAGAITVGYADSLHRREASVASSVQLDTRWLSAGASGLYARDDAGAWTTQGQAAASLFTPSLPGARWLRGELGASTGGSTHQDGTSTGETLLQGRLHLASTAWGGWIGGGGGQAWDGAGWRKLTLGDAGVWSAEGATKLVVSATPTVVHQEDGSQVHYTDVQGSLRWTLPRLTVTTLFGTRVGQHLAAFPGDATAWGNISAVVWLWRSVAVVADGGNYPIDFAQGFPGGRYASLGLRLQAHRRRGGESDFASLTSGDAIPHATATADAHTSPLPFDVRETDGTGHARRTFRVRAGAAGRVEISGDFTSWQSRALTAAEDGWWEVTLPVPSGVHQMTLRVDGGPWLVPQGLAPLTDEFGGVVGVVVVP